jgi:hypothetical protein
VKYDLNVPAIKWRVGFGDDPELVNSVIVTASGLLFGAGRDTALRARDTDTGAQVWSSRFGGDQSRPCGAARLGRVRGAAQVTHVFQCSC